MNFFDEQNVLNIDMGFSNKFEQSALGKVNFKFCYWLLASENGINGDAETLIN